MDQFRVTLTGETALLLHHDNLAWAESMKQWGKDPANKTISVAGDDRSPAWRWIGNLYVNQDVVVISSDNLMTLLREGGKLCPVGKGAKTFKAQTQSGIHVNQIGWPITVNGRAVPYGPIRELSNNDSFAQHEELVGSLGFCLFVKRARIGQAKHVRVRPRFDNWQVQGTITVFDDMLTEEVLQQILTFAGKYCGLGDWRPSSPKSPGPFGKFTAKVEKI